MHFRLLWVAFVLSFSLEGKPSGCRVVSGDATHSTDGAALIIQSGKKTILEWDRFSIDLGEAVRFQQLDRNSAVLNRVIGGHMSELHGALFSNGKVYLINPNGVLIGPNGRIETAHFVASTLDVLNQDFLNEDFHFSGAGLGSIVNLGKISCPSGSVTLIGRKVQNSGQIDADQVNLAVGAEVLLVPDDEQQVFIRSGVEMIEPLDGAGIEHTGSIAALAVEMRSGESPYEKAIHCSGEIHANAVEEKGGRVYLVAEEGVCELSGNIYAPGGKVRVLGTDVGVVDGAGIDVSAAVGGGEVLLGGDYQGSNPAIKNAETLRVARDVKIHADALELGDGGKVVCWSDFQTEFYGQISARGGKNGGDGGMVEISSPASLKLDGFKTYLNAPAGKTGHLLLDPNDITVGASATTGTFATCGNYSIVTGTGTNQILNTDLNSQLQNCNVTISTVGSNGTGPNNGSITVSSAVGAAGAWSAATTLNLIANSFINITAAITNTSATTGFTAMAFTANGTGATTNNGISIAAALTTTGGNIILFGSSSNAASAGHGVNISAGGIVSTNGNIQVAGAVPSGPTSVSIGVRTAMLNPITTAGTISVSGTSAATGSGSHGVSVTTSTWTTGTSGLVTFGGTITNPSGGSPSTISGCQATGSGTASHGLNISTAFSTTGSITAINSIIGSTGTGSHGFANSAAVSSTGAGNINITASTTAGGATLSNGINVGAVINTTGAGTIRLIGTGSSSVTSSTRGISCGFAVSNSTGTGSISIAGIAPANPGNPSAVGVGAVIANSNVVTSAGGGAINISGQSSATGTGSHGVSCLASQATGTSGTVTFGSTITDGTVSVTGCQGGPGTSSNGLNIAGTFSAVGSITATNLIVGGSGATCNGVSGGTVSSTGGGNINFTASTNSTGAGTSNGIVTTAFTTTSTGTIKLIGTGSNASTGTTIGVNATATTTGTGTISVAGRVPTDGLGGPAAVGIGVLLSASNPIVSAGGAINVSGTSVASGAGSHGVSVTGAWVTSTSGTVTFGSTITDGTVSISGCTGGSGSASHGINMGNTFSTTGAVTATNSIIGGSGTGSHGFSSGFNFASSSAGNIAITASTTGGGATSSHGINLTAGTLSTTGAGTIVLIGTGSATNTVSSNGVNISGGIVSNSTGTGAISVAGTVPTSTAGTPTGIGVLMGTTNGIVSAGGGAINVSGTSLASGAGSHGVSATSAWTTGTSAIVTFGSTITDGTVSVTGCTGGTGAASHGINMGAAFSTADGITATNSIIGGSGLGSSGFLSTSTVTSTGASAIAITASTSDTTSKPISLGGNITSTGGSITLVGNTALTASVTLNSGTSGGNVSVTGSVTGAQTFILTSGAGAISVTGAVDLSGTPGSPLTATAAGNITFSSSVNTSGTTNGAAITMTSSGGSLSIGSMNSSGTTGTGGNITLQPATTFQVTSVGQIPVGTIQLTGTAVNASGGTSGGTISLAVSSRAFYPSVATIFGSSSALNSITFSCRDLLMGVFESMTSYNSLTLNCTNSATVSDLVAFNNLSVVCPNTILLPRSPIALLASNGTFYTSQTSHILAGTTPTFSTPIMPTGADTGISGATFAELTYAPLSLPLNFDIHNTVTPLSPNLGPQIVNLFAVANAQLSDLLPLIDAWWYWPYHGLLCEKKSCLNKKLFDFETFLIENRLKE